MPANDVDRLGYGDCKRYLIIRHWSSGVPSYYTELYGDSNIRDIEADFSIQGNHVILCIPTGLKIYFECTSQTDPLVFKLILPMTEMS
jgi:hypothetical protein